MDLARTTIAGRLCGRAAMLFAKCFAMVLLFVSPAHATMQQIACEHLPTAYGQAYDGAKSTKLILRAQIDKTACPLVDVDRDGDPMIVSDSVAIAPVEETAEPLAFGVSAFVGFRDTLALKRAPPHDTVHF